MYISQYLWSPTCEQHWLHAYITELTLLTCYWPEILTYWPCQELIGSAFHLLCSPLCRTNILKEYYFRTNIGIKSMYMYLSNSFFTFSSVVSCSCGWLLFGNAFFKTAANVFNFLLGWWTISSCNSASWLCSLLMLSVTSKVLSSIRTKVLVSLAKYTIQSLGSKNCKHQGSLKHYDQDTEAVTCLK